MSAIIQDSPVIRRRPTEAGPHRWTRDEFYQMAAEGYFEGQRVMLIDGEIIDMPPMGHPHFRMVDRISTWLKQVLGSNHWVRMQGPLNVGRDSEPEPDVAVAEHPEIHYSDHPFAALLVVEVSDSTLRIDRRKAGLYASAKIPEYWLVNLTANQVEVYRRPVENEKSKFGFSYGERRVLDMNDELSPLARPEAKIRIADLLK